MTCKPSKFGRWLKIEQSLVRGFDRDKIFRIGFVNFDHDFGGLTVTKFLGVDL